MTPMMLRKFFGRSFGHLPGRIPTSRAFLKWKKWDKVSPYDQLRNLRGIQWPAPTYAIAKAGGTKRRYMLQEGDWENRPYGYFRTKDGKVHFKLCQQDYSNRKEITKKLMEFGSKEGVYTIDNIALLEEARDKGLTPDLPDDEFRDNNMGGCSKR